MRDLERIQPFLEAIEALWFDNPDWRFGQLVMGIADTGEHNPQLFYMEDEDFLAKLEALKNKLKE